jgi:hypothetical protein
MQSTTGSSVRHDAATQGEMLRLTHSAGLVAAWGAAGGAAGGSLVALLVLTGRMYPGGSATAALLLSVAGGCLGLVHGAMLARLGRQDAGPPRPGERTVAVGVATAAVLGAAMLSVWLTTSAVLARADRFWGWAALLAGAMVVTAVGLLATHLGWIALERSWTAWRERRLGSLLVAGTFVVTATALLLLEPALPGGRTTLTPLGCLVVAALATLWIAAPLIIVALRTVVRRHAQRLE